MLLAGTLLFGAAYPLMVTAGAQALFPSRAHGSMVVSHGNTVGSELIGQSFTSPRYFWPRPSATTPPYNAAASGASNLGSSNADLRKQVAARVKALRAAGPENGRPVPADLVEASASGLDPHISPAAAEYQVARVAHVRGMSEQEVRDLVRRNTYRPQLGILGQPRVNVLKLNLALDGR